LYVRAAPAQERTAKRARLKEENASAYIQAGDALPDGGDAPGPAPAAISSDAKVGSRVLPSSAPIQLRNWLFKVGSRVFC
jgi:hypothetical protein